MEATGMEVTGAAQQAAWRERTVPGVERVRPGLWSVPVPLAGSQTTSSGRGAVSSTISWMMCRGVRNCPFCPAVAILPSMYS